MLVANISSRWNVGRVDLIFRTLDAPGAQGTKFTVDKRAQITSVSFVKATRNIINYGESGFLTIMVSFLPLLIFLVFVSLYKIQLIYQISLKWTNLNNFYVKYGLKVQIWKPWFTKQTRRWRWSIIFIYYNSEMEQFRPVLKFVFFWICYG